MAAELWTICGSIRDCYTDMIRVAEQEEAAGRIALIPYAVANAESCRAMVDQLHRDRIDVSVGIIVVTRGGRVGKSTSDEIRYAEEHGKQVRYVDLRANPPMAAEDPVECDGGPYCSAERHYAFCLKNEEVQ